MKSFDERFWQKVSKKEDDSCWEWNAAFMNGYGWFSFNKQEGPKFAHRVSALLSGLIDDINSDLHVLHKCDNTKCCNPKHLFVGTNADNVADRVKKNRTKFVSKYGEANGMSKLTSDDVVSVRNLYKNKDISQSKIAKMFNIKQPQVSRIVNQLRRGVS
jgi:predicted XRE-type DNA-binding protein